MTPALRTHFVTELLAAITSINPSFEAFGQRIADRLSPTTLQHRGLNAEGAPVGHVVDSSSSEGFVVFEYSAQQDYFDPPYKKIVKDWCHARRTHPNVRVLYLLSSRECGPKAHSRLVRFTARAKERLGVEVQVYDARRLAEYIVDVMLPTDRALDELAPFLGPLKRIQASYQATHRVPDASDIYVARPALEATLLDRLARDRVLVLAGLSGIGKSDLAAAIARAARAHYDAVVWVPDAAVRSAPDLESVPVERAGARTNVRHLLREYASLVVLDNVSGAVDTHSLAAACGPGSAVLITRQVLEPGAEEVPLFEPGEARDLLSRRAGTACPDAVFVEVWGAVGGFPLAINLLGGLAAVAPWDDVVASLPAVGEAMDPGRMERLADRVLGRLQMPLKRQIAFLRWCGTADVDAGLAKHVLTPVGMHAFRQTGLLAAERRGTLRLHDVVRASVATLDPPGIAVEAEFERAAAAYLGATAGTGAAEVELLNAGRLHRGLWTRLAREFRGEPAYLYALLQIWHASEFDADLVGDIGARAQALVAGQAPATDLAVNTVLEAVEAQWRYDKDQAGVPDAQATLRSHLATYDLLEQVPGLSPNARRDVRHQHAKALRNVGDQAGALRLSEAVVAEGPPSAAAMLLLGRLLAGRPAGARDPERARALFEGILEWADADAQAVGTSALLAAISEFGREVMNAWAPDVMDRFHPLIHRTLVDAAARALPQGLQALAVVARFYGWHAPDRLDAILAEVPPTFAAQATAAQDRAAWADILLAAGHTDDPGRARAHLEHALAIYAGLECPDNFQLQQHGRVLYELGRLEEAASVLAPLAAQANQLYGRYWLSKVRLAEGDAGSALALVDDALAQLPTGSRYCSAFLHHRYAVRSALGDPAATDDLRRALAETRDARYKCLLAEQLEAASAAVTASFDGQTADAASVAGENPEAD
jgi:hypothetical protein